MTRPTAASAADRPVPWIKTPLLESDKLSRAAGWYHHLSALERSGKLITHSRIFLKLENLQPSASFKLRGIGNLVRSEVLARPLGTRLHLFCSSGGNAGLACVKAANHYDCDVTIVVSHLVSPFTIDQIRAAGSGRKVRVVQAGASWQESDDHMRQVEMAKVPDAVYVPPFDDPRIWDGHASMMDEVRTQLSEMDGEVGPHAGKPDVVICSVGGGGMFCGVVEGLERNFGPLYGAANGSAAGGPGMQPARVLAVETRGADSLAASIRAGKHVRLPKMTSMAITLGAVRVAPRAFELASTRSENIDCVVVSDAEAAMGCWQLADDERLLAEPSCGASVSLCYGGRLRKILPQLEPESRVVVVVCGGANATLEMLADYRRTYGDMLRDEASVTRLANGT